MPLTSAALVPHGYPIIPELSDDAEGALQSRAAMLELGESVQAIRPDALVLAGPHGVRVEGTICLANVARAAGTLHWHERVVEMNVPCARELVLDLAEACRTIHIPVALASFAGNRSDQSIAPLDWGAMTPLWFLGHGRHLAGLGNVLASAPAVDLGPPVALVTPSRSLPREDMVRFGEVVAQVAEASEWRVAFIASCDWGHTHRQDGPYGYHSAAAEVDAQVVAAIRANQVESLISLSEVEVDAAAIDGLWQLLMIGGAQRVVALRSRLMSYEAPSYYGMIVAMFDREDGRS